MKDTRGRPKENIEKKMIFVVDYGDSKWHYNLNKYPRGPYLVEHLTLHTINLKNYIINQKN